MKPDATPQRAIKKHPFFGAPMERVMRRVEFDTNGGCWLWFGGVNSNGWVEYPMFWSGSKAKGQQRVHRAVYEHTQGPIPEGLVVRHKCDVTYCVNPAHLELGTLKDNAQDRERRGRGRYAKQRRAAA